MTIKLTRPSTTPARRPVSGRAEDAKDRMDRNAAKFYPDTKAGPDLLNIPGQVHGYAMLESEIAKRERSPAFFTAHAEQGAAVGRAVRTKGLAIARATNEGIAARITSRFMDAEIAEARRTTPLTEDERNAAERRNIEAALERLHGKYGEKDALDLLARTRKLVKSTPALAEMMSAHDLGSTPDVVEDLAEFVRSAGYR